MNKGDEDAERYLVRVRSRFGAANKSRRANYSHYAQGFGGNDLTIISLSVFSYRHGRGKGGKDPPWILKILAKSVIFLVLSGKSQISPLLAPRGKILEKSPCDSAGKTPSDGHAYRYR